MIIGHYNYLYIFVARESDTKEWWSHWMFTSPTHDNLLVSNRIQSASFPTFDEQTNDQDNNINDHQPEYD